MRYGDGIIQRGYLWQRAWTPAVVDAVHEADNQLGGIIVLGAEIGWRDGEPQPIGANISWPDLQTMRKPCSIAMRIAPYFGPFAENDPTAIAIVAEAVSLLKIARMRGVEPSEFEIDFDCAQDKLKGYASWLHALAKIVHPTRLVITTLPALAEIGHTAFCDPTLARKWVNKASRFGIPFSVALPTYWCLAGYDPTGKLIGLAKDGVHPSWPAGTNMLEFGPNADDIANLVKEWRVDRPREMRGVLMVSPTRGN